MRLEFSLLLCSWSEVDDHCVLPISLEIRMVKVILADSKAQCGWTVAVN